MEHSNINDQNSPIIFKGVVFNEMKGHFVSVLENMIVLKRLTNLNFRQALKIFTLKLFKIFSSLVIRTLISVVENPLILWI